VFCGKNLPLLPVKRLRGVPAGHLSAEAPQKRFSEARAKGEPKERVMRTSSTLIGRLSGLATIVGGLLWALGGPTALNADILGIGMEGPHLLITLAGLCSLIGLTRLASHHARHYGLAGMAGTIVASAGVVLIIASKNPPLTWTSDATGWAVFAAGVLLVVVGSLLFGIVALLVGKVWLFGVPLVAIGVLGILQLVFFLLMMGSFAETAYLGTLGTVVLPILFGIAWSVLGYALWSDRSELVRRPAHRAS
jgi:hypothetical protein